MKKAQVSQWLCASRCSSEEAKKQRRRVRNIVSELRANEFVEAQACVNVWMQLKSDLVVTGTWKADAHFLWEMLGTEATAQRENVKGKAILLFEECLCFGLFIHDAEPLIMAGTRYFIDIYILPLSNCEYVVAIPHDLEVPIKVHRIGRKAVRELVNILSRA